MKLLDHEDLECLALGAAILGSGGGGSPSYNHLIARYMMETYGPAQMISPDELKENDLVAPLAFMGAPLVALEKIPSGKEFPAILKAIRKEVGRLPTVFMAAEIGGANAFTPIWVSSMLQIPFLDADTIGRAFPELQMSSCTIHNVSASPAFLADSLGNSVTIQADNSHTLERIARHVTMAFGSRAAVSLYLMQGLEARDKTVPGSVTKAIEIGKAIRSARINKTDPTAAVLQASNGVKLGSGIISDVEHKIDGGFLKGKIKISPREGEPIELLYQNEFLIAFQGNRPLASTPDILMLMEQESGTPVTSSSVEFGVRVDLIALPSPEIWTTEKGLQLTGPRYFGYSIDYQPILRGVT